MSICTFFVILSMLVTSLALGGMALASTQTVKLQCQPSGLAGTAAIEGQVVSTDTLPGYFGVTTSYLALLDAEGNKILETKAPLTFITLKVQGAEGVGYFAHYNASPVMPFEEIWVGTDNQPTSPSYISHNGVRYSMICSFSAQ